MKVLGNRKPFLAMGTLPKSSVTRDLGNEPPQVAVYSKRRLGVGRNEIFAVSHRSPGVACHEPPPCPGSRGCQGRFRCRRAGHTRLALNPWRVGVHVAPDPDPEGGAESQASDRQLQRGCMDFRSRVCGAGAGGLAAGRSGSRVRSATGRSPASPPPRPPAGPGPRCSAPPLTR